MTKIQEYRCGMQTQQGALLSDILVLQKIFILSDYHHRFGSGDWICRFCKACFTGHYCTGNIISAAENTFISNQMKKINI